MLCSALSGVQTRFPARACTTHCAFTRIRRPLSRVRRSVLTRPASSKLETSVAVLAKITVGALAAWVDGAGLLSQYHGFPTIELDAIADRSAQILQEAGVSVD